MGPIVVIDNYDSFVYNLVQILGGLGAELEVLRNDEMTVGEIGALDPCGVVVSPGPGRPEDAGVSKQAIAHFANAGVPILGVCLGHQCIGEVFGADIAPAAEIMHGKTSFIHHDGSGVFEGIPSPFEATRYHSLVVRSDSVPTDLVVSASTADGTVMGLRHSTLAVEGVQFHPESILTPYGQQLLENFLSAVSSGTNSRAF